MSSGAIAGIVVAAVAVGMIILAMILLSKKGANVEFDSNTKEFNAHSEAVRNENSTSSDMASGSDV